MGLYYPSTGKMTYFITFDWGEYIVTTEEKQNVDVHADSKPYLGYITFRPEVSKQSSKEPPQFYLITPAGEVWGNATGQGIPEVSERKEVTKEKKEFSTSTTTLNIQSVSEPIIDHFKSHSDQWTRYGILEHHGNKTRLKLEEL